MELFCARQRRKFSRGIKRAPITVLKKLRKVQSEKTAYGEKPVAVKTHLRNMVIVPEMIGSVVGVYNGKQYITVEIKPEMIGHYLGEFSITYKPIKHGRAGMMSKNSQFVPLKPITVLKKLRKAKRETAYGEKPVAVKTHLRNMVIVFLGSVVGVYNGKQYITVEIKPEMIGHYLGEFSITYKPIKHGRAGMMSKNSQFVPLK
eukprot:Skav232389  [mRNA]  locus=scaffold1077:410914:424287:- [translate_table: standard]